jgi:Tfp pilus assembly protein PilF
MTLPLIVLAASLGMLKAPALQATEPSAVKSTDVASSSTSQDAIEAGLKAFKRRRFTQAEGEFRKAVEADPGSAAAHFYLGYTYYKMGEPARRMNDNKEKAKVEFARAFEIDPQFRPVWGSRK